jgi:hypothetical protein
MDCWWERFDVRSFLQAHLPEEVMAQVERAGVAPPPSKVLSLVDLIQQAKDRIGVEKPDAEPGRKPEA